MSFAIYLATIAELHIMKPDGTSCVWFKVIFIMETIPLYIESNWEVRMTQSSCFNLNTCWLLMESSVPHTRESNSHCKILLFSDWELCAVLQEQPTMTNPSTEKVTLSFFLKQTRIHSYLINEYQIYISLTHILWEYHDTKIHITLHKTKPYVFSH